MSTTKEHKIKSPKLRFKEFQGEWEEKRFKELLSINQGLQIPIKCRLTKNTPGSLFYITNEFLKPNSSYKYYIKSLILYNLYSFIGISGLRISRFKHILISICFPFLFELLY